MHFTNEEFYIIEDKWNTDVATNIEAMHAAVMLAPNPFEYLIERSRNAFCDNQIARITEYTGENYEHVIEAIEKTGNDDDYHVRSFFQPQPNEPAWAYEYAQATARVTRILLNIFNVNLGEGHRETETLKVIEAVVAKRANISPMDVVYARLTGKYVWQHMLLEQEKIEEAGENLALFRAFNQDNSRFNDGLIDLMEIPPFVLPMAIAEPITNSHYRTPNNRLVRPRAEPPTVARVQRRRLG